MSGTDFDAKRLRHRRPDAAPFEDFAVCEVVGLARGLRSRCAPREGVGNEASVDGLPRPRTPPREAERLPVLFEDRGVRADDRGQVHHDAVVRTDDQLRAPDAEGPTVLRGLVADVVLLQPVEVLVLIARETLSCRHGHGVHVHAVRLRALQEAHVLQPLGRLRQRVHQVLEHRQIRVHLIALLPARDEARLLVDRGVDDVGDVGQLAERLLARVCVAQIHR